MVQVFQTGPSRRGMLAEMLGQSLGQGLGNLTGSYFANKDLERVLNDKSLQDKPASERMSALETALRPHGERGMNMLQRRLGIEQQRMQEQEQAREEQRLAEENKKNQIKSLVLNKRAQGKEFTPEESALFSPQEHIAIQKAFSPKGASGGLSGQPVPTEIAQKIPQILNENLDSNADELAVRLDEAGIPRAYSNSYIENRRRQDEQSAKTGQKKTELSLNRDNEILKEADAFRNLIPTEEASINAMEDAITTGEQGFWSADNLAEMTGLELFRTAKGGQFKTGAKTFLINNVSKFGARPNQYIEQQIADSLAKIGRSREANLASLELIKFDSDVKKKYIDVIDDIEQEGSYRPGTIGREAQSRMKKYVEQRQIELSNQLKELQKQEDKNKGKDKAPAGFVRMQDPKTGAIWDIEKGENSEAALKDKWIPL